MEQPLGRRRSSSKNIIKMDLKEMRQECKIQGLFAAC
jgi:hypothetical protein